MGGIVTFLKKKSDLPSYTIVTSLFTVGIHADFITHFYSMLGV